ncbi:hypothetical protein VPH35_020044 [Triticum aestivum]
MPPCTSVTEYFMDAHTAWTGIRLFSYGSPKLHSVERSSVEAKQFAVPRPRDDFNCCCEAMCHGSTSLIH